MKEIEIREFGSNLEKYINTNETVAVMHHGQTVGYFLPTYKKPGHLELKSLKMAAESLDRLLADSGITEDELAKEFYQLRLDKGELS